MKIPHRIGQRFSLPALFLTALCLTVFSGCANFVETKAITTFTQALQEENLTGLKGSTSSRFGEKALRVPESVDDFAILRLPKGDLEITDVKDVDKDTKEVTAKFGKSNQKFRYLLVRDANTRKWVVDDVLIRKKKDGITSTKPVTELMDLVTRVREFLVAWDSGIRGEMLEVSTPEFGEHLSKLPRGYLAKLAEKAIGDRAEDRKFRPEAQLDEDVAVVRLPRRSGQMIISFQKMGGEWLISDLAVESKRDKDHIPSVRQLATALSSAVAFLNAYNEGDKDGLKEVCLKPFYQSSLLPANLESVSLPDAAQAVDTFQIKLHTGLADFVVPHGQELVKINLDRIEGEDSDTPVKFLVSDVTLYELEGNQEKRLSAMFLSHAIVDIFAEGLVTRDKDTLRLTATPDFQERVWKKLSESELLDLEMPEIETAVPKVMTTVFMGALTEVTVQQGTRALVYVLRDHDGALLVDDVLMPVVSRPNSLKQTLEVTIPVRRFAAAVSAGDLERLPLISSKDFCLSVWHSCERIPEIGVKPGEHFEVPLTTLQIKGDRAVAVLGDDRYGARVLLEKENGAYVIDDVLLISGPEARQRVELKNTLRLELSRFRGNGRQAAGTPGAPLVRQPSLKNAIGPTR
jgi:hypothetical protein